MRRLELAGRLIDDDAPSYVIAEIGGNHGGSVVTALDLVRSSARCGASAVKFQKRDVAHLYSPALLAAPYEHEHSYGPTYGAHRAALELSPIALAACFAEATAQGVMGFATAFDERSADVLETLGVPAFKLASSSLTDAALLRYVARVGKPILLSTGGGTDRDIACAVRTVGDLAPLALLHCTASYPLQAEHANLRCILTLRRQYPDLVIGFSSHSPGIAFSLIAYAFGARILEHHVTLSRAGKGTDQAFSLEPKGLQTLVEDVGKLRHALGDGVKVVYDSERGPMAKMRRRETPDGWQITGAVR